MVFWPFSSRKLPNCCEDWTMTEQVVKSKDLRRKTKKWMAVFFTNCVRNVIEKAVSICIIIPQNRRVKKIGTSQWRSKFRAQRYGDKLPKKLESLEEKKAVHTSWKHGVRRICKLYTKEGLAGKLMWCEPTRDHLDYRWRDNIQISSPQNTRRVKTVTTLHLEKCELDTL